MKKVIFILLMLSNATIFAGVSFSEPSPLEVAENFKEFHLYSAREKEKFVDSVASSARAAGYVLPTVYDLSTNLQRQKLIDALTGSDEESYKMAMFALKDYVTAGRSNYFNMSASHIAALLTKLGEGLQSGDWKPNYCEVQCFCDDIYWGIGLTNRAQRKRVSAIRQLIETSQVEMDSLIGLVSDCGAGKISNSENYYCGMYW